MLFYETSVLIVCVCESLVYCLKICFLLTSVSERFENLGFHFIVSQTFFSGSFALEFPQGGLVKNADSRTCKESVFVTSSPVSLVLYLCT